MENPRRGLHVPPRLVVAPPRGDGKLLGGFGRCHGDGADVAVGGGRRLEGYDGEVEVQGRRVVLGVDLELGDGDELVRVSVVNGAHGNHSRAVTVLFF